MQKTETQMHNHTAARNHLNILTRTQMYTINATINITMKSVFS